VTGLLLTLLTLLVLVVVGLWFSWTATRLDQLHHRIDLGRESLRTQLALRSGVVLELAGSGSLDVAASLLLADAAQRARRAPDGQAESDLSQALRAVFDEPAVVTALRDDEAGPGLADELAAACRKVELARRFLNDQVTSAKALRSRRRVRWFGLAGHAPAPVTVDLDDVPPRGLDGA
jgi:hypothetical protein